MNAAADLTVTQAKALQLLLAGSTVAAAARELGIDRTTIYAWRKSNPRFAYALNHARSLQSQIIADGLQDLASTALDTLHDLLTSPEVPASARLRAAQTVLNAAAQTKQTATTEAIIEPPQNSPHFDTFDKPVTTIRHDHPKTGRNEPCPCGSGLKFKRCCGNPVHTGLASAA